MNEKQIIAAERKLYMKEWRAKNKDKTKAYNEAYWLKKAQERAEAEAEQDKGND